MTNLEKLFNGLGWGSVSVVTLTAFQLVFMVVMARLLEPADFGTVAIANVSLRFFGYFAQMGIAPGLIQKKQLEEEDIGAALAISVGVSSIFCLMVIISAEYIAFFYGVENIDLILKILSINFIIFGFSAVSIGLIRRNKKFRELAIIEIASYLVGYGLVGLITAYSGGGVWALVAAVMTQSLSVAILGYAKTRHTLSFKHSVVNRAHFINFGSKYSVNGFVEFLTSNIDAITIGKIFGETSAGYYNRALLLANMPVQQPANILTRSLFPIMSEYSDVREKQSISFQLSVLVIGCYSFAVGIGINLAAPAIVVVMLGDKWLNAIPILEILAISVGPIYVSHVASVALDSMNRLKEKMAIQVCALILMLVLLVLSVKTGSLTNIAFALLATEIFRMMLMLALIKKILNISAVDSLKILTGVVAITGVVGISIAVTRYFILDGVNELYQLASFATVGAIGVAVGAMTIRTHISNLPAITLLRTRIHFVDRFFSG